MPLEKILLCLDTDPQPSAFDAIVAVDAGVDHLLRHGRVTSDQVRSLVYGAMFTRRDADLNNSALFIGGSDVEAGESLLRQARECFFGPMRISVMLDSNGANTTAAAAVLSITKHQALSGQTVAVLAATGSVGRRIVRLLAREGARVRVASRDLARARQVCEAVRRDVPQAALEPVEMRDAASLRTATQGATVAIAAGAPGVELMPKEVRSADSSLRVVIDLNAVPPGGVGGVEPQDKGVARGAQICYGAIGIGSLKMKLHKAAIRRLFERNDLVLDAEEIYAMGKTL